MYSNYFSDLPIRQQCNNQSYLAWIYLFAHTTNFNILSYNLKWCRLPCPCPGQHVYHLLNAENTEVESNFLKSTIKTESKYLWIWLINNVCCLGQLESVGDSGLICCKNLLKFSAKYPMWCFLCCSVNGEKLFVREIQISLTYTGTYYRQTPHTHTAHATDRHT